MTLEDYLDAVAFRQHLVPPPPDKWCDELRVRSGARSFMGIG